MKKRFLVLIYFSVALIVLFANTNTIAQCNGFNKKKCMPKLLPFEHNGNTSSSEMANGEMMSLLMTFSPGKDYRILLCAEENLGKVQFRMVDANKKIFFDTKNKEYVDHFDFAVKSTQQMTVEITVPASTKPHSQKGCVSVMVGSKKRVALNPRDN